MKTYGCDGCIVGVDIYNVEIEAYGCEILEPEGNRIPAVGKPSLKRVEDFLSLELDPFRDGRIPMVLDSAMRIAERNPNIQVRIPLVGPFTIACHLLGIENCLCELAVNPEPMATALLHLADNQLKYANAAVNKGLKLSVFDSSVTPPILSPRMFSDYVLPSLTRLLHGLPDESAKDIQLIIGGDTVHILDAIASLTPSYIICPVETDQEEFLSRAANYRNMIVRVNMDPSIFLPGRRDVAMTEVKRVIDLANRHGSEVIGSILPYDADTRIVREIAEWIELGQ